MKSLIIDRPELQSPMQRYGFGGVTLLFWLIYVYLWLPMLTLVAWVLGFTRIFDEMVIEGGYAALARVLLIYLLVILVIGSIYLGWARINYVRFRGVERRKTQERVSDQELADHFSVSLDTLNHWQQAKSLFITHDEDGNVVAAINRSPEPAPRGINITY
ncbi:MAG: poly-beta-1,6-N-acetyl-D-glucosamine biosynthesis protein PgaD [Anaerolineae bacterium]|nr:poly-beta-1,6-N-acetyl-D-glucosamine biosynthesis protein PgaD [Anaerolineae bacterium]